MELRTYTGLWKVERRLYKFYDINLPYPVSARQIGTFLGSFIPWIILMNLVGVPFGPPFGHVLWLFPPALFTWYANRPVAEGKSLMEYAFSQIKYFLSHKKYADLSKTFKNPKKVAIQGQVWTAEWAVK